MRLEGVYTTCAAFCGYVDVPCYIVLLFYRFSVLPGTIFMHYYDEHDTKTG